MSKNSQNAPVTLKCVTSGGVDPVCGQEDIHVWLAVFDFTRPVQAGLLDVLSPDEKERASRYISEEARQRFIAARGTLRCLLARYLSTQPAHIVFSYSRHGRPVVTSPAATREVVFNLSHSAEKVLYAISGGLQVGVDLERMRSLDFTGISKRFFTSEEATILASLSATEQSKAFFECWTRKEAFAKAQGTGLYLDLNQVEVSLGPGAMPRVVQVRGNKTEASHWSLYDIDAGEGFKAALAARSRNVRLVLRNYPADISSWVE